MAETRSVKVCNIPESDLEKFQERWTAKGWTNISTTPNGAQDHDGEALHDVTAVAPLVDPSAPTAPPGMAPQAPPPPVT